MLTLKMLLLVVMVTQMVLKYMSIMATQLLNYALIFIFLAASNQEKSLNIHS